MKKENEEPSQETKLRNKMLTLASKIKQIELDILILSENYLEKEIILENRLLRLKDTIANELDTQGKPIYSNDMKRQSALTEMKSKDDVINRFEEEIKKIKHDVEVQKIDLRFEKNLFDVAKLMYQHGVV